MRSNRPRDITDREFTAQFVSLLKQLDYHIHLLDAGEFVLRNGLALTTQTRASI